MSKGAYLCFIGKCGKSVLVIYWSSFHKPTIIKPSRSLSAQIQLGFFYSYCWFL